MRDIVVDQIGDNIDQLLDVKLMVIRHIEAKPELANRMFREIGERELKFIINFGFFFGLVCGIPVIFIVKAFPHWWVLPILGAVIGYVTNWLAISMIFEPIEPRKVLGRTLAGAVPQAPGPRGATSTRRSSPTRSSPSPTSATSCCTARAPTARAP